MSLVLQVLSHKPIFLTWRSKGITKVIMIDCIDVKIFQQKPKMSTCKTKSQEIMANHRIVVQIFTDIGIHKAMQLAWLKVALYI